ncbi:hypothetical protein S83_012591 [Arachis hypogaea]
MHQGLQAVIELPATMTISIREPSNSMSSPPTVGSNGFLVLDVWLGSSTNWGNGGNGTSQKESLRFRADDFNDNEQSRVQIHARNPHPFDGTSVDTGNVLTEHYRRRR